MQDNNAYYVILVWVRAPSHYPLITANSQNNKPRKTTRSTRTQTANYNARTKAKLHRSNDRSIKFGKFELSHQEIYSFLRSRITKFNKKYDSFLMLQGILMDYDSQGHFSPKMADEVEKVVQWWGVEEVLYSLDKMSAVNYIKAKLKNTSSARKSYVSEEAKNLIRAYLNNGETLSAANEKKARDFIVAIGKPASISMKQIDKELGLDQKKVHDELTIKARSKKTFSKKINRSKANEDITVNVKSRKLFRKRQRGPIRFEMVTTENGDQLKPIGKVRTKKIELATVA